MDHVKQGSSVTLIDIIYTRFISSSISNNIRTAIVYASNSINDPVRMPT